MRSQELMRVLKTKAIKHLEVRHHATTQYGTSLPGSRGYYEPPTPPPATNQLFQPMPKQNFVAPQPRDAQNYEEQDAGDADGEGAAENGEDPPGDAETEWIDSDSKDDTGAEPTLDFLIVTVIIGGLSEDCQIVKEWMPEGYGPPHRTPQGMSVPAVPEITNASDETEYAAIGCRATILDRREPSGVCGPEDATESATVASRDSSQFRIINELGHPMMASQQLHGICDQFVSSTRVINNSPHATIIRHQQQHPQAMYKGPQ
ncbi:hypothetical protein CRE_03368 [Caenorhabditis remanei]|uniref:Uncharacterized protein n=1 Tax=Caenorhabditis remanei TaxID=31234 RepID=E3N665_CAERE|nr:hypothetical protein CRE_03368 [Caenorhabditis remanei]